MKIQYFKEYSHYLGREMEFKVYGHAGKPMMAFPSQNGRFFDLENNGIIETMKPWIDSGKLQVFCVDSIDPESFSDEHKNKRWRIEAQEAYYNYIVNEAVARTFEINTYGNGGGRASGIITYGCSMGAYHAMNFFLRRPDLFDGVLALSGIYKASFFFGDYMDDLVYLNSPVDALNGIGGNNYYLDLYKRSKICVCVGQGAWEAECVENTKHLEHLFHKNNIPVWFDYWGFDVPHDWPSWLRQTPYFLNFIL